MLLLKYNKLVSWQTKSSHHSSILIYAGFTLSQFGATIGTAFLWEKDSCVTPIYFLAPLPLQLRPLHDVLDLVYGLLMFCYINCFFLSFCLNSMVCMIVHLHFLSTPLKFSDIAIPVCIDMDIRQRFVSLIWICIHHIDMKWYMGSDRQKIYSMSRSQEHTCTT